MNKSQLLDVIEEVLNKECPHRDPWVDMDLVNAIIEAEGEELYKEVLEKNGMNQELVKIDACWGANVPEALAGN